MNEWREQIKGQFQSIIFRQCMSISVVQKFQKWIQKWMARLPCDGSHIPPHGPKGVGSKGSVARHSISKGKMILKKLE